MKLKPYFWKLWKLFSAYLYFPWWKKIIYIKRYITVFCTKYHFWVVCWKKTLCRCLFYNANQNFSYLIYQAWPYLMKSPYHKYPNPGSGPSFYIKLPNIPQNLGWASTKMAKGLFYKINQNTNIKILSIIFFIQRNSICFSKLFKMDFVD